MADELDLAKTQVELLVALSDRMHEMGIRLDRIQRELATQDRMITELRRELMMRSVTKETSQ